MVSQAKLRGKKIKKPVLILVYTKKPNPFKATKSPQKSSSEERHPVRREDYSQPNRCHKSHSVSKQK